ncbi:MAG TPA: hypothetical protein VNO43_01910 [Candidatus Eisenbacteria bacterium]|nr:hypothetical protein [Candidatus Eisenbacteria bacterium]
MEGNRSIDIARLEKRRQQILATLSYVEEQRREVEHNTEWKDAASQLSRRRLLNDLRQWYLAAMRKVEKARARIPDDKYGLCLSCNSPIEREWLEACPETELCTTCQNLR